MSDRTNDRGGGGGKGRPPSRGGARGGAGGKPAGDRPARGPGGPKRPGGFGKDGPRDAAGPRAARPARPPRDAAERPARPPRDAGDRPRRDAAERPFRARGDEAGERRPGKPAGSAGPKRFGGGKDAGGARSAGPRKGAAPRTFSGDRAGGTRPGAEAAPAAPKREFSERIAKVIARAGLCSRRDAEAWIEEGRVAVNGVTLTSPALDVSAQDVVVVDGAPLPTRERTRLFLYHKPRGVVTTVRDPEGRRTVFDALPPGLPRVITVGRLDINTEGLLLLTNDGGLARVLSLPETGWLRKYRVRAYGEVTQPQLDALRDGVTIEGMHYGPIEASLDRAQGDNAWLTLGLREGKNREVKKILEHLGLQVNRLIRLSFGPFQLGDLPEGAADEVRTRVLQDQLGPELSAQAEVDFEAPVFVYDEDDFRPKARQDEADRRDRDDRRPTREGGAPASGREPVGGDSRQRRRSEPTVWGAPERDGPPRDRTRGRDRPDETLDEKPKPKRRHPMEPLTSVWRADDAEAMVPRGKIPRRGADPKLARAESAEKSHQRAGKVKDPKGRAVRVERIARDPAAHIREEAYVEKPRGRSRPSTGAPRGGDRPDGRKPYAGRSAEGPPRAERPKRNVWSDAPAEGERRAGPAKPSTFKPRTFKHRDGDAPRGAGERPARSFKPRGDRAPGEGRPGGDRPSRGDRPAGAGFKPRGDGPRGPRPGGPGGSRPGGSRPGGSRPGGSGGGRPPRRPREG
ncbi:pseudouridine synthase [Alsobacter sp. KACC 23698]|uniref:Pseudouridine synthase n=1 Tax=Alsobacter sp. KACC 23698 TaxID=3149229 RepID=A0AAU7JHS2_9HYPH